MNSALPLAPVAAFTASVQVFQVAASQGGGGSAAAAAAAKAGSAIAGVDRPLRPRATIRAASRTLARFVAHREPERLAAADAERREALAHGLVGHARARAGR